MVVELVVGWVFDSKAAELAAGMEQDPVCQVQVAEESLHVEE